MQTEANGAMMTPPTAYFGLFTGHRSTASMRAGLTPVDARRCATGKTGYILAGQSS